MLQINFKIAKALHTNFLLKSLFLKDFQITGGGGGCKLGSTISCAIGIFLTVLGTLANLKPHFSFFFFFLLPLSQATTEPPKKKPDPVTSETVVIWGLRLWQVIGIFAIFVLAVSKS